MASSSTDASNLLDLQRRIDECCDRFEAAWKAGQSPNIEDYLAEATAIEQPRLLRELLAIEMIYWSRANGQPLSKLKFLELHPALAPLINRNIDLLFAAGTGDRTLRDERLQPIDGHVRPGHVAQTRCDSHGLHIRCPHCQNPVELLADSPLESISCSACGDSFSLVEREGQTDSRTPLKRIGRFELTARLGMGGFGTVWKAHDTDLDRTVALKIPRKGQLSPLEVEQFFREARAAAQLKHPNIVPVHEVGREEGTIFIVTDLIHGATLDEWLKKEAPDAKETAAMCAVIADALHFAHSRGVVHRDLKPSNVMVDGEGQPHLMDFGLAKRDVGEITMTVEGQILGTPAYMSPEQAQGQTSWIDRRSDIYSMGVVLFELLTRELPYRGGVQQQLQQRIRDDAPSPQKLNSHVPIDLATICLKCLERDPNRRYATAAQLADELRRFLRGEPIVARPISASARAWRWAQRNPALATAGVLTVLLAIGGPLAAISIEGARRTTAAQRNKIQAQLIERNAVVADGERRSNKLSSDNQQLRKELNSLFTANPGIERIVPDWKRKLVENYLKKHEPAIQAALQSNDYAAGAKVRARIGLAYMLTEVDRNEEALAHFQAAAALLSDVIRKAPDEEANRLALADCFMQISALQRAQKRNALSQESARQALSIREELAKRRPENATYQIDYFDSILETDPVATSTKAEDVRAQLEQQWSASPSDLYELSCYLTHRRPLLNTKQQAAESR